MARVVESILPQCGRALQYEKVVTKELKGALRYRELSKALGRLAPVPSIFINGELVFDVTPSAEVLKAYLDNLLTLS